MSVSNISGMVEPVRTEFRWKIEDFSSKMILNVGESVDSPCFSSSLSNSCIATWCLRMYPAGETEISKEYIGLYLVCNSDIEVKIGYSLSILDESTKTVYVRELVTEEEFTVKEEMSGFNSFLKKKSIIKEGKSMLTDNALIISCEIFIPGLHEYNDDDDDETTLVNDYYEELLTNGKFSDVTVNVDGKIMLLHKNVLSSVSGVFQAMFDHNMRENNENQVKIKDIKDDVALEMFRYIYCGRVNSLEIIAADLFEAADIYCIVGLKKFCEKSLLSTLSIDNALVCLRLVTMYETFYLKPKVIEFVVNNLKALVKQPGYKQLSMECKDEIIMAMAGIKDS